MSNAARVGLTAASAGTLTLAVPCAQQYQNNGGHEGERRDQRTVAIAVLHHP